MPSSATPTTRRRVAGGRFFLLPLVLLLLAMGGARAGLLWGGGGSDAAAATSSTLALGAQVEPVHLDWEGIDCLLTTKDGRRKHLLKGVSRRGRKLQVHLVRWCMRTLQAGGQMGSIDWDRDWVMRCVVGLGVYAALDGVPSR